MRVLLIAEEANPEWVSVPLEGWAHSRAIARLVDAHVVTQVRNRDAFLRAGLSPQEFTAIDNESVARPLWKLVSLIRGGEGKGWTTLMALKRLAYRSFETQVWKVFGSAIRDGQFDVVHRLTPLSPTVPSRLAAWCRRAKVPFVLGPLNGGVPWPPGFDSARRREREWLSYIRGMYRILPGFRSTRRNSAALIIGSMDTWRQMPPRYWPKCVYVPENAVDANRFDLMQSQGPRMPGPLRIVFVGRLVPYKGADMLIEAVSQLLAEGRAVLEIIGDGPERESLEGLASRRGLGASIVWSGWLPHHLVAEHLRRADVMGFPSVREFGGAVVLEAMSLGVVPVVLAYGGPGELVTKKCGFPLPMGNREEIIDRFRRVLGALADNPGQIAPMGVAAQDRVRRHFTWDAKALQVQRVYKWVVGEGDKPEFGMPLSDDS